MTKKTKDNAKDQQAVDELTSDLQRVRADFENYRKNSDLEKERARTVGRKSAIISLLPVIDNIERAIANRPKELDGNTWADGIEKVAKSLDKTLNNLDIKRIDAAKGKTFDPSLHEAVQFDGAADDGEQVIDGELQAGYILGDEVVRHAMVRVTTKSK